MNFRRSYIDKRNCSYQTSAKLLSVQMLFSRDRYQLSCKQFRLRIWNWSCETAQRWDLSPLRNIHILTKLAEIGSPSRWTSSELLWWWVLLIWEESGRKEPKGRMMDRGGSIGVFNRYFALIAMRCLETQLKDGGSLQISCIINS